MTTAMPANVRFAVASDEDEIMRLMHAAFKEQPIFPLNEHKMRGAKRKCTLENLNDRKGFVAVIDGPDGLEAYLIAVFAQYWYTDAFHIEELSNFVHPDHRRGKHHPTRNRPVGDHDGHPGLSNDHGRPRPFRHRANERDGEEPANHRDRERREVAGPPRRRTSQRSRRG